MRIPFNALVQKFESILIRRKVEKNRARRSALNFAAASADGVCSHGVNRFPRVIDYIEKGYIDPAAIAEKISGNGPCEHWNGHLGLGNLNAEICMDRACELAKKYGVGVVALRNTNHWMRGGSYGWQAANAGCTGICWTNTMPNMPPWGSRECRIGNNPFVMSFPRSNGAHVVIDCAIVYFARSVHPFRAGCATVTL